MDKNLRDSPSRLAALSERKSPARPKTPARTKSKSPARNKSPARPKSSPAAAARPKSPSRQKSPSRATKSDEKKPRAKSKSPSRKAPAAAKDKKPRVASKSPSRSKLKIVVERIDNAIERSLSPDVAELLRKSRSRERSAAIEEMRASQERSSVSVEPSGVTLRRSTRVKSSIELDGFASTDRILKANHVATSKPAAKEFGGWPGALLLTFLLPLTVLGLQLSCLTKERCKILTISTPPISWKYYLDLTVAQWFSGFIALQALLSALPLGRVKQGVAQRYGLANPKYRCTGFQIALITLAGVGALLYLGYPVTILLSKTVSLLVLSIIFGVILSVALFVKGGRPSAVPNPKGNTGNVIYDFWIGREINPRLGLFDLKQFLVRFAVIESLVYDSIILWKAVENKAVTAYPPTIVAITALQALSLLDYLWHEEQFLSTFHIQHEGTGYMTVLASLVWPFAFTFIPKYLLLNSIETNIFVLPVIVVAFLIGFVIYRLSNNQKDLFRKNPSHPALMCYPVIQTSNAKKLLCGGWWGWVRHPNYLGSLIMYWSFVLAAAVAASSGVAHWAPFVTPLAMSAFLVHRAVRDHARCQTVYHNAWDRYTQKVRYQLVPKVF